MTALGLSEYVAPLGKIKTCRIAHERVVRTSSVEKIIRRFGRSQDERRLAHHNDGDDITFRCVGSAQRHTSMQVIVSNR